MLWCYRPMKRFLVVFLFLTIVLPTSVHAAEPLTRRDGFLTIWQSIRRPALPAKTAFHDLPETERGSLEIDYAASRGLIDDEEGMFRPDDTLHLEQALIWLFRSRNVTDDPKEISTETLSGVLLRYPIAHLPSDAENPVVNDEELTTLMRLLDQQLMEEDHEVSLYAEKFHGKGTAFGEAFDMYALTAAHRSFPPNTLVKVTNIANGKSVTVRINDRGPYHPGRDMDLSLAAFTAIEDRSKGKFRATFQRLGDSTLVDVCGDDRPMQQRIARSTILRDGVPHQFVLGKTLTLSSTSRFVVRGVQYPDGLFSKLQDFILEGETFTFKPSTEGTYHFLVGSVDGKMREMTMQVARCGAEEEA